MRAGNDKARTHHRGWSETEAHNVNLQTTGRVLGNGRSFVLWSRWVLPPLLALLSELTRKNPRSSELFVRFLALGEDAVADFQVFQGDGLALLHEDGLVVDHDRLLTLPRIADFDLVAVD